MSDHDEQLALVRHAAESLLPQLTERLARLGLGELEITQGELRIRVVGGATTSVGIAPRAGVAEPETPAAASIGGPARQGVTSPAVGFFVYADALGPGLEVQKGDELGHVEMLGIRHDVRAPRGGRVTNLVSEAGEPVEYGQLLIELEPAG